MYSFLNKYSRFKEGYKSYEPTVQPLKPDNDNEQLKSSINQPFYLNRKPSFDKPFDENPRSPIFQRSSDSTSSKPKWDVRLPQLLNSTVGPDRSVILMKTTFSSSILCFFSLSVSV